MGADRLFREHPDDPPRKRRKRLISYLHPTLKRMVKISISQFPPALKRQFQVLAERSGVSTVSVLSYGLILYQASLSREERLKTMRDSRFFPDASDDELERVFAETLEQVHAEMNANRKRK